MCLMDPWVIFTANIDMEQTFQKGKQTWQRNKECYSLRCCQRLYMVIPHFDHKFLILLQMQLSGVAKQILVQNANTA